MCIVLVSIITCGGARCDLETFVTRSGFHAFGVAQSSEVGRSADTNCAEEAIVGTAMLATAFIFYRQGSVGD